MSRAGKPLVAMNEDFPSAVLTAETENDIISANWLNIFKENYKAEVLEISDEKIVFQMVGIDASIANALRRIMIAEVPTMAIENVFVYDNTSVIQDEVFCHRLGLVPIKVDPVLFNDAPAEGVSPTELDTLVFKLDVKFPSNVVAGDADYLTVKSGALEWVPQGDQLEKLKSVRPVHEDIILAKLKPGQAIKVECHAVKGVGMTHAKWSPVCTASYRMLPIVDLKTSIRGKDAEAMKKKCPMNVFDIEDSQLVVANPLNCTVCRECIREPEWQDKIKLYRQRNHFIFSVESSGCIPAPVIVKRSIQKLKSKAQDILASVSGVDAMDVDASGA